jgi:hypothetical protein
MNSWVNRHRNRCIEREIESGRIDSGSSIDTEMDVDASPTQTRHLSWPRLSSPNRHRNRLIDKKKSPNRQKNRRIEGEMESEIAGRIDSWSSIDTEISRDASPTQSRHLSWPRLSWPLYLRFLYPFPVIAVSLHISSPLTHSIRSLICLTHPRHLQLTHGISLICLLSPAVRLIGHSSIRFDSLLCNAPHGGRGGKVLRKTTVQCAVMQAASLICFTVLESNI